MSTQQVSRLAIGLLEDALATFRVAVLVGPRQSGKTTLARSFARGAPFLSLDDAATLAAVRADPVAFVRGADRLVIDEVQRAPDLILAIKSEVDRDPRAGRFLLTGSADVRTLPRIMDSLAGRAGVVRLYPLAQAEIEEAGAPTLLKRLFEGLPPPAPAPQSSTLPQRVLRGGYPEVVFGLKESQRALWMREYVAAVTGRDIPEIAEVAKLSELPRLLAAIAAQAGGLLNLRKLGGELGLDSKTVDRYAILLEHVFLIRRIPAWSTNALSRLVKTPKVQFIDSGLLASLRRITNLDGAHRTHLGVLLESFVYGELLKLAELNTDPLSIMHHRTRDGGEVDFILEAGPDAVIGVEVKSSVGVRQDAFRGLAAIRDAMGRRFRGGVVLHDGDHVLPFGDRLWSAPVASLWAPDAT
jgi:predicted AAA+ superfamily ATPase